MIRRGFVKTLVGRRRRVHEVFSKDEAEAARGRRQTVNSIIQGSASDVLKAAMVKINNEFKTRNLDAHILLQIHDELVIECLKEHTQEVCEITQHYMEHPFAKDLNVPLSAEPKVCYRWGEAK